MSGGLRIFFFMHHVLLCLSPRSLTLNTLFLDVWKMLTSGYRPEHSERLLKGSLSGLLGSFLALFPTWQFQFLHETKRPWKLAMERQRDAATWCWINPTCTCCSSFWFSTQILSFTCVVGNMLWNAVLEILLVLLVNSFVGLNEAWPCQRLG